MTAAAARRPGAPFSGSQMRRTLWQVGAAGMCFTGGFALAMAVEPVLGMDAAGLTAVTARTGDGLCVLGLRFSADRAALDRMMEFFAERLLA